MLVVPWTDVSGAAIPQTLAYSITSLGRNRTDCGIEAHAL